MNFIFSFILAFACQNTDVLVLGDSQASRWSWGGAIEEQMLECGASVDRYSLRGWTNEQLWAFVRGEEHSDRYGVFPGHTDKYELVVLIGGGNDVMSGDYVDEAVEMIQYFEAGGSTVFYSILPPATDIADMEFAVDNFHYLKGSENERHWHTTGLYERRMIYRESLRSMIFNLTDAHVLDIVEVAENVGYTIPDFPDGIHIPYNVAQDLAKCIMPFADC